MELAGAIRSYNACSVVSAHRWYRSVGGERRRKRSARPSNRSSSFHFHFHLPSLPISLPPERGSRVKGKHYSQQTPLPVYDAMLQTGRDTSRWMRDDDEMDPA